MKSNYSISDLEFYSGIKAHTIRIWEKRYALLSPHRSCTNIRGYDACQLRKLLNINNLLKTGWKISKIAGLSPEELDDEIRKTHGCNKSEQLDFLMNSLIVHMLNYDTLKFEEIFQQAVDQMGFKEAILNLIYPFLTRLGVLWQINDISPAQEHFASAIIRRKLISKINELTTIPKNGSRVLLCLPEGEYHEISLLLAQYLVLKNNFDCIYLGSSVTAEAAAGAIRQTRPDFFFTVFMIHSTSSKTEDYLNLIYKECPDVPLFYSGSPQICNQVKTPPTVTYLPCIHDFNLMLERQNSISLQEMLVLRPSPSTV